MLPKDGLCGNALERAGNRCEYCRLHQDHSPLATLQIEHINPRNHGGTDTIENLALACIDCNLSKSSNIAGRDPQSSGIIALFDPRRDVWADHFQFAEAYIVGTTAIGATLDRLTHRCHILEASGQSYRLRDAKRRKQTTGSSGTGAKSNQ